MPTFQIDVAASHVYLRRIESTNSKKKKNQDIPHVTVCSFHMCQMAVF